MSMSLCLPFSVAIQIFRNTTLTKHAKYSNVFSPMLQEIIIRTSLETQRLELVSEISNMKLHQAAYERENSELREKIRQSDHLSDNAKMQVSFHCSEPNNIHLNF